MVTYDSGANSQDEVLIDKCPKCSAVFFDYDGCNAVTCSRCTEAFCAVCLEACGRDAHAHVRTKHGNLYDAPAASEARLERQRAGLAEALRDVAPEIRKQAEKILAKIMEELAVVATKERKKYGKVERNARLLSMLEELRELFAYYKSGEGPFEAVLPEITLLLKSEGGDDKWCLEILDNQVVPRNPVVPGASKSNQASNLNISRDLHSVKIKKLNCSKLNNFAQFLDFFVFNLD